ncbi:hypothetical protein [Natronorubrum daqingense]|uniref:DUF8159 domain-containing protein n=1 Tax=Natronorubrum daqingense TaxID=588898 RepID=A0A1N7DNE5_9EURY|nr:hypothetical protein [Natronorubrum daqingense]APX96076.1 hypothetical protein BB347_05280 [Natronorubrum daqingense]SIR77291.1 hypothetical protein SAMN05421809_2138 [Natronorubrum daqingense]
MSDARPIEVALENRLMGQGIYVDEVTRLPRASNEETAETGDISDGAGLSISYETVSQSKRIDSDEVGTVVRTVLDIGAEREWTPGRLEATSQSTDGDIRGRWHVEAEWFDELGVAFDDLEFSERVLETRDHNSVTE